MHSEGHGTWFLIPSFHTSQSCTMTCKKKSSSGIGCNTFLSDPPFCLFLKTDMCMHFCDTMCIKMQSIKRAWNLTIFYFGPAVQTLYDCTIIAYCKWNCCWRIFYTTLCLIATVSVLLIPKCAIIFASWDAAGTWFCTEVLHFIAFYCITFNLHHH